MLTMVTVIPYADATTIQFNGKTCHPVYLTLGNLTILNRNKDFGKKLVGFIPAFTVPAGTNDALARSWKRQVHNGALAIILGPIITNASGVVIKYSDQVTK